MEASHGDVRGLRVFAATVRQSFCGATSAAGTEGPPSTGGSNMQ